MQAIFTKAHFKAKAKKGLLMYKWLILLEKIKSEKKASNYALAKILNISEQAVSQIFKEKNDIAPLTKLKIALLSDADLKELAEQIVREDNEKKIEKEQVKLDTKLKKLKTDSKNH